MQGYAITETDTQDGYVDAATLICPGTARLNITVSNQPALYQLGRGWPSPTWDAAEHKLLPVIASLERRVDAIRFRSAVPGKPAKVSVAAIPADL